MCLIFRLSSRYVYFCDTKTAMDYSFVPFLCIISLVKTEESKRLLLNDPDVIGSRLSNIEKSMQEMTKVTTQLQAEFGTRKSSDADYYLSVTNGSNSSNKRYTL